jgi:predicted dienelactone hydrolase
LADVSTLAAGRCIALVLFLLGGSARVLAACTQDVSAPDEDQPPIAVKIWVPEVLCAANAANAASAANARPATLPLVIISHGTGGSSMGHIDTAIALANAGFVVAAPMHTGDNYRDMSYVGKGLHLIRRPRQVMHVLDYLLRDWPDADVIDPQRIGMLGHSAGGFTALVIAGGVPDLSIAVRRCQERPQAWECQYIRQHGLDIDKPQVLPPPVWEHDPRVKALVVATPCCGWTFKPNGLANVKIPVQLWEAQQDLIVEDSPAIVGGLLPQPPEEHVIANAGHFSFVAPCDPGMKAYFAAATARGEGEDICADAAGFDRAAFHQQFNAAVVAFFSKALPARDR